jgi:hypothetical protein
MAADVGGTEAPEWVRTYESGLSAYEDRRWSKAISLFEATAALRNGDDRPSRILVERCHACLAHPPPTNGCRFQCWNRNRNPKRQGYDFAFSTTFIQEPSLRRGVDVD